MTSHYKTEKLLPIGIELECATQNQLKAAQEDGTVALIAKRRTAFNYIRM